MKWLIYALAAALFLVGSAVRADDKPADKKTDSPSYTKDIKPFIAMYCGNCHNAKVPRSGFSLDSYDALVKGGRKGPAVVANDTDKSVLVRVMTGKGKRMPPSKNKNQPKAEEIDMVKAWINAGATDDTPSDDKKGEKSGAAPGAPAYFVRAFADLMDVFTIPSGECPLE
jgi:hypothetical protein